MEQPAVYSSFAERERRRINNTLQKMIKDRGYSQLEVQASLGLGRTYLSQLFAAKMSLRADIMLALLARIGVHPCRFYFELCKDFDPRIDLPEADATRNTRGDPHHKQMPMSEQGPEARTAPSGLVASELDRLRKCLCKMVKDRGYTQVEVQEKYGWYRQRLSDIFRGVSSLSVDTILAVLFAIGVNPQRFYYVLCRDFDPLTNRPNLDEYKHSTVGPANWPPKYLASAKIQPQERAVDLSLAEREYGRIIKTLKKMMKDRGYNQADLQTHFGWGREYLSRFFTRKAPMRAELMLSVLVAIGVQPCRFYYELSKGFDPTTDVPEIAAPGHARAGPNEKKSTISEQSPEAAPAQSGLVARELDRLLKTLHKMIKHRGYSQLGVQWKCGWYPTRLTQIFQGDIRLRVDTMLAVLFAIGVRPRWFYHELCRDFHPLTDRPNLDEYKHGRVGGADCPPEYLVRAKRQPTQPGGAAAWGIEMASPGDYPVPLGRLCSYPDPKEETNEHPEDGPAEDGSDS